MAMNFNDLIGPKSKAGSIQNFVRYARVPGEVILEEAQTLIFQILRVREMRAGTLISLPLYAFTAALPTGYLEPISMRDREGWEVIPDKYVSQIDLLNIRANDSDVVTTLNGSVTASAASIIVASAAKFPASGQFAVKVDAEVMLITAGAGTTTWTVTRGYGGTTAAAHSSGAVVDGMLEAGTPTRVAVFDELFQFDCRADAVRYLDLAFWKSPPMLSATNTTNFLTRRYPHIIRCACNMAAANFMKDNDERSSQEQRLMTLCMQANAESDQGNAT